MGGGRGEKDSPSSVLVIVGGRWEGKGRMMMMMMMMILGAQRGEGKWLLPESTSWPAGHRPSHTFP